MTIGFLLNTCEPFYRGGYERRAWSFARELARQGHDVRIYTSCARDETIEGVRFVRLAKPRKFFNARGVRNGTSDLLFAFATLKLLVKLKRGELDALDVCATPFVHLPFVAAVMKLKRIPAVLTCHEALLDALPDYVRERGSAGGIGAQLSVQALAFVYRVGMGLFRHRVAVSWRTAEALEKEGSPARDVVEFGLEPEAFAPVEPQPRPSNSIVRLISCGRLTPTKRVGTVLFSAFEARGGEGLPFRLEIIGDGSERARLERWVLQTGTSEIVTFHGDVSEERKRELLAASDIFVLGSPREGFSIATLEAMAQGCATLVVNDPARPNGVLDFVRSGQEGLVVDPGQVSMIEGLRHLMENTGERETLRRGAYETAKCYQIDAQAKRLVAAYGSRD